MYKINSTKLNLFTGMNKIKIISQNRHLISEVDCINKKDFLLLNMIQDHLTKS